jgi:O-acetyl-ADP-ribose deacetylase (regulator of RNase III)
MKGQVLNGDLLDQDVDVIVNARSRRIIPWWLLLPQGVSGAIKRRGGVGPFKELATPGPIPLGGAVLTSAGRLPFKAIIHVAGINMLWRASEWSIRQCVRNAMALAHEKGFRSIAFPLIGAGSGGFNGERAKTIMEDELGKMEYPIDVRLVLFGKYERLSGQRGAAMASLSKVQFEPQWKELLICRMDGRRFVIELTMGVLTVYFRTQSTWEASAPDWAKRQWERVRGDLSAWCLEQGIPLQIVDGAWVEFG